MLINAKVPCLKDGSLDNKKDKTLIDLKNDVGRKTPDELVFIRDYWQAGPLFIHTLELSGRAPRVHHFASY